jgi:hypothetical protein
MAHEISDDEIMSLWYTVRPSWYQHEAMTKKYDLYPDEPTAALRLLVELAVEEGRKRGEK